MGWHWDEGGRVVVAMGLQWDHARGHGGRDMVAMGWLWGKGCRDVAALGWHWDCSGAEHGDVGALG